MRKVLAVGSIGIVVVLVLASFSVLVNAQTIKPSTYFKNLKEVIEKNDWYPGYFFLGIISLILFLIVRRLQSPPIK